MKVSFKIGAIKMNATKEAHTITTRSIIERNGVKLNVPEVKEQEHVPAKQMSFEMEASEIQFECEVGELAEIYREYAPMVKDIIAGIVEVKKAMYGNRCDMERVKQAGKSPVIE